MRKFVSVLSLVAMLGLVTAVQAGDTCNKSAGAGKASMTCDKSACASIGAPQMIMYVGDEKFDCPHAAGEAAKKSGKPLMYAVGNQKFDNAEKAWVVYADSMDSFVTKFATVSDKPLCTASCESKCCSSDKKASAIAGAATAAKGDDKATCAKGKYYVAGKAFECKDEAAKTAKLVSTAMDQVKMQYRVDGKDFCCDKMAGDACKSSGKNMSYVVSGNEVHCKYMARVELDKAKIAAAMKALNGGTQTASKA